MIMNLIPLLGYFGPGTSVGAIVLIIVTLVAVVAAFFGFLWFPIKRLLKKKEDNQSAGQSADVHPEADRRPKADPDEE